MRHSAPAREAMPQKQPRCQSRESKSHLKVSRIVLRFRHKKFSRRGENFVARWREWRFGKAIQEAMIRAEGNFRDI
jgi:hypothetical protein